MTNQKENNINIESVSDYLKEVSNCLNDLKRETNSTLFCYRGEDKIYGENGSIFTPAMPNIFRPNTFRDFCNYDWFEKNILDEVKSNNLSNSENYLEIAMDAQHGGFPSRLLDVSFNSLVALFFAVAPYYMCKINEHDDTDGRVIVIATDKMSTSNTQSIIDIYHKLVVEKKYKSILDSYFHMLIDFVDLNSRIKAQQGGFILFGGNQFIPIPDERMKEIIIPRKSKEKIREELDLYFGINMGMIYPEIDKKVEYLTNRSLVIENDFDYYSTIIDEIKFYLDAKIDHLEFILSTHVQENNDREYNEILNNLSKYIYTVSTVINKEIDCNDQNKNQATNYIKEMLNEKMQYINNLTSEKRNGNVINPKLYL